MEHIAILTNGLWKLRAEVAALTGMEPVRWDPIRRPAFGAVAGWGHKATAGRARRLAARSGKPYLALEDGPLRSVRPGPAQPPMSMVVDRAGIYYEAGGPSDLLDMMTNLDWFNPAFEERARAAAGQLRRLRLSKYNSGRERSPDELGLRRDAPVRVLVLDQVQDDASVRGAGAGASAFREMLAAALSDNPAAEIVVKLHPDVLSGRRAGYFSDLAASERVRLIAEPVNPWSLLEPTDAVYTVSSGLGFEAVLAGKNVVCFGAPFYSGWGFTDDRGVGLARPGKATPLALFAAYYLRYARYLDAYSRQEIAFEAACEQLAWLRDRFHAQPNRAVCHRIARWKRRTVDRMLDGPAGPPLHLREAEAAVRAAKANGGPVVAWASRDDVRLGAACADAGVKLVRAEDGFIRSAGLGASFVLPLSLVFDGRGIYYDSATPSDLEALLSEADFTPELLDQARRLRATLVARRLTKYNVVTAAAAGVEAGGRRIILVPGQVEDDASIRKGSPKIQRNVDLLRAVRSRHPEAFIIYKPHPDVEAGFRRGRVPRDAALALADRIETGASILHLIESCDTVETMTSLAGFEALLRGKSVVTHGQPFYAGWSLTEDLCPPPRRGRALSLDELVAAALIFYPRYLDPVSGLPCGPELLVERLVSAVRSEPSARDRAARIAGTAAARALHLLRLLKSRFR